MPRTKRVNTFTITKRSVCISETEDVKLHMNYNKSSLKLDDIHKHFTSQMKKMDDLHEEIVAGLKRKIITMKLTFQPQELEMTCEEFDLYKKDKEKHREGSRRTHNEDAIPKRLTRSHSQDLFQDLMPMPQKRAPQTASKFRTPNCNIAPSGLTYNMITPKVQPNKIITIARRPREGELAFAMTGSPLLVSTSYSNADRMANVNFPLPNGAVMSILPELGLRPDDLPDMDEDTYEQLHKLRENLNSILDK